MSGRRLKILLGISLALNVFVIGAVIGVLVLRHQVLTRAAAAADPLLSAADALAPAQRNAFRATMQARLQSVRPGLRDARQRRHEAMMRIRAEPFDRAAAASDLAAARADDAAARGAVEDAILDFAGALPQDQRAAFVRGVTHAAAVRWMAAHPGLKPPASNSGPER